MVNGTLAVLTQVFGADEREDEAHNAETSAPATPPLRRSEAHAVVDGTLAVLYQKLEQARLDLVNSTEVGTAAPLVALVKDISAAIADLEKL